MSSREDPMIYRLWERVGGTLIMEFPVVKKSTSQERRRIDAIILPNGKRQKAVVADMSLGGLDVIVVQAKAHRLGMALMGQALFSQLLVEAYHRPKSSRTIALVGANDSNLSPLLAQFPSISVQVDDLAGNAKEPILIRPDRDMIEAYWKRVGGLRFDDYPLTGKTATSAEQSAHAIILPQLHRAHLVGQPMPLAGHDVIVVHSTPRRLDMWTLGKVVFAAELIKRYHPKSVRSVALCKANDSALAPLLKQFPHVVVVPNHYG